MAEKRGTGNYGSWGYGLERPISNRIEDMLEESAFKMRKDDSMQVRLYHQGRHEALKEIESDIFDVEIAYSKSINRRLDEERRSGYGRGDSMG